MTYTSSASKSKYAGNGVATQFPTGFKFLKSSQVKVLLVTVSGPVPLIENTDYTVAGAGAVSGTVTYPKAGSARQVLAAGETLTIYLAPQIAQETKISNTSTLWLEEVEVALDLLTMICLSLQEETGRSVKVAIQDTTDPAALIAQLRTDAANATTSASSAVASANAAAASATAAQAASGGVKVSGNDTTHGDLEAKLLAGTGVLLSTQNDGASETRTVAVDVGTSAGKIPVLDGGGKLATAIIPSGISSVDLTARDIAMMTSMIVWRNAGLASGPMPGGGLYPMQSADLTVANGAYDATKKRYQNQTANGAKTTLTAGQISSVGSATVVSLPALIDGVTAQNSGFSFYNGAAAGGGIVLDAGVGQGFNLAQLKVYSYGGGAASAFNVDYCDEGSTTWVNIGNFTANPSSWSALTNAYSVGKRRYIRMVLSGTQAANSGYYSEIELWEYAASNMVLTTPALTIAAPKSLAVEIGHVAIDAVTLGTDLRVRASLDGGTTWSDYASIVKLCDMPIDSSQLVKATIDVSALTGSSVKVEVSTANAKAQAVCCIGVLKAA